MKKIILSLFVVTTLAFSAQAQEDRKTEKKEVRRGQERGMLREDLNLTESQKAQLEANRQEMRAKIDALNQNKALTEEQRRAEIEQLKNSQKSKMESILSAEQKAKLEQSRKNRIETAGRGERKIGAEGQRRSKGEMKEQLGLSDDQSSKLRALHESTKTQIEAVKNNASLSEEAKKQQIQAIKENAKTQRNRILTPDQQKKMKEYKSHQRKKQHRNKAV
jgi:Spy/CpxP family protein refolding chaperone